MDSWVVTRLFKSLFAILTSSSSCLSFSFSFIKAVFFFLIFWRSYAISFCMTSSLLILIYLIVYLSCSFSDLILLRSPDDCKSFVFVRLNDEIVCSRFFLDRQVVSTRTELWFRPFCRAWNLGDIEIILSEWVTTLPHFSFLVCSLLSWAAHSSLFWNESNSLGDVFL